MKKPYHLLTVFLLFVLIYIPLTAQPSTSVAPSLTCATDAALQALLQRQPQQQTVHKQIDQLLYQILDNTRHSSHKRFGAIPLQSNTIPVVVHIMHNNGEENISDQQIRDAILHLNEAFGNRGVYHSDNGVDIGINFCLARQDEHGQTTTGITRTQSLLTNLTIETNDIEMKDMNRWDPTRYLNIWIVREISSLSSGAGVAGYAYFPSSHGNPEDGIVVEARYFGSSTDNSKVHIHEAGHYLGLYHTFQGGCGNKNCLLDGDHICDTPPDASTIPVPCSASINTCSSDGDDHSTNNPFRPVREGGIGEQNDLFINYMDYGALECYESFTTGQKERIIASLAQIRTSLLASNGCINPCLAQMEASFTPSATTITNGTTVSFTNTSTGAKTYRWLVGGAEFATTKDASYTFNSTGMHIITLEIFNDEPACTQTYTDTIDVRCNARAVFTASAQTIQPGETVIFTNTGTGATEYSWYIDGVSMASTKNFTHLFPAIGGYNVYLVVTNGKCRDTSDFTYIQVGNCLQQEAKVWYFGKGAGIDFRTGIVTLLKDGNLNTLEGCASICDASGKLLFYTNGVTVWNGQHQVMSNGTNLAGHESATQSAIIVPRPQTPGIYYIFTVDAVENLLRKGLSYSVVDMTLDAGKGNVVTKNVPLTKNATERLTAARHCNGTDYWILSHEKNSANFQAYLLTRNGIAESPVISAEGSSHAGGEWRAAGSMKVSPNGRRAAIAIRDGSGSTSAELFDFDNQTGTLHFVASFPIVNDLAMSVEFSPDNSKLYFTAGTYLQSGKLYQVDLSSNNPSSFVASQKLIASSSRWWGVLQLAPNGKIYMGRWMSNYLGVINNPNALEEDCDFTEDGFNLGTRTSYLGLPNFIAYYLVSTAPTITGATEICLSSTEQLYTLRQAPNSCTPSPKYRWEIKNGTITSTPTSVTASVQFTEPGRDTIIVHAFSDCGSQSDTLIVTVTPQVLVNLGPDTLLCSSSTITLDAGPGYNSYLWSDGSTERTLTTTVPGVYWVEVQSASGCSAIDTLVIAPGRDMPAVSLIADTTVCEGTVLVLEAQPGYRSYRWQDGSKERTFTAFTAGTYYVQAIDGCDNVSTDTVVIREFTNVLHVSNDTTLCSGTSVRLSAAGAIAYTWSPATGLDDPSSASPIASPATTTTYIVTGLYNDGCSRSKQVTINIFEPTTFTLSMPDTLAITGTKNFRLPVVLQHTAALSNITASIEFTVRYRALLFALSSVSNGNFTITRDQEYEIVHITIPVSNIQSSGRQIITELIGQVLLGDVLSTDLLLSDITFNNCQQTIFRTGTLTLDPASTCELLLRRVRLLDNSSLQVVVSPNPADEGTDITVATSEEGAHTLAIYNIQGQLLWQNVFYHSGSQSPHIIPLNIGVFTTGVYQVVVTAPSQTGTTLLSIVR